MKKSIRKLSELKVKLVTTRDFHATFNYFFDHFGENHDFMGTGTPKYNERLQQVLATCAQPILKQSVIKMVNIKMIYVEEQKFYHGAAMINHMMANFFYFEDIDSGLIALAPSSLQGETIIVRFSLQMLDEKPEPSKN